MDKWPRRSVLIPVFLCLVWFGPEKALERGDKIEVLETRTQELSLSAANFKSSSKNLHQKMWCNNCKSYVVLIVVLVVRPLP